MARTGPKLSPNPGKTAKFYRKNKKSREKHRRDNAVINDTDTKRAYRRELMKVRRERNPSKLIDMSHKGGKIVSESRKKNRGRGGKNKA